MPHDLIGFQSVTIGVEDVPAAVRQVALLGFAVRDGDDGTALVGFGNFHLIFSAKAPAGYGRVGLASRNLAASKASLGAAPLETPGLNVDLTAEPALPAALHANGAVALSSLTAVVEKPNDATTAYDRLFGLFAATPTDEMVTVHGCGPMLFLVSEDGFDHLHSNLQNRLPKAPALASIAIAVADLDAAEAYLARAGVKMGRSGPSIAIHPSACFGLGLELVES